MKTTKTFRSAALALGAVLIFSAGSVASSREADVEGAKSPYEITPYFGYQTGGDFSVEGTDEKGHVPGHASYALALNFRADTEGQYQVFYSRQPAHVQGTSAFPDGVDVDIDYVHFGGTLRVDPGSLLEPFIVGSVGATLLSSHLPDTQDNQVFSVGVGAGLRIPVRPRFNILLEARAFISFLPSGGSLFCSSGQTGAECRLHGSGSTFTQYAVMAGAAFAF
jgi:hypothetical protein